MTFWPFRRRGTGPEGSTQDSTSKTAGKMTCWPSKTRQQDSAQADELRIATSGSFSIKALVEMLRVDGAGGFATQPARVRAAIFSPGAATTLQFHADPSGEPGRKRRHSPMHREESPQPKTGPPPARVQATTPPRSTGPAGASPDVPDLAGARGGGASCRPGTPAWSPQEQEPSGTRVAWPHSPGGARHTQMATVQATLT